MSNQTQTNEALDRLECRIFKSISNLKQDLVYKASSWEQVCFLRGKILALESLLQKGDDGFA